MKRFLLLLLLLLPKIIFPQKMAGEEIKLLGVENPVSFTISPDGLRMILVDMPRKGAPVMNKLYRPYLESTWGAAAPIESINQKITEETFIGAPCFNHDGNCFFFAANFNDTYGGTDIYMCTFDNGKCGKPVNIGKPVNSEMNENNPSISGNNRNLFFTRDITIKKFENFNTGELWSSELDSTSTHWQTPSKTNTIINCGGINNPKIADDNNTIIYSLLTDKKDEWQLYWAKRLGDIHWYLPLPIDTLNTKFSELCPVWCKPDQHLYFIRNKRSTRNPDCSLYRFPVEKRFQPEKTISVSGKITNPVDNLPVQANILVTDPVLGKIKYYTCSNTENGEWNMILNASDDLMFHSWKEGFSHDYEYFSTPKTDNDFTYNLQLFNEIILSLNIYDKEELWPLNGTVKVFDNEGRQLDIPIREVHTGKVVLTLPIGIDYIISASMKDYIINDLKLALSNTVLYDHFERDIELEPVKRDIEFMVTGSETKNPLNANILLINKDKGYQIIPHEGKTKGLYFATLREGEAFDVEVRGPRGFAFKHLDFDLDNQRQLKKVDIELNPLKIKVPIRLNNINFEFNSADLMESSYEELNRVFQLLIENPSIKAEIMAHTDDIGSEKYNNKLAQKRAQSVTIYLVTKGIDAERLISKGYGETMPLVPNDTEENRAINRRVELKIIDLFNQEINEIEKEFIPE